MGSLHARKEVDDLTIEPLDQAGDMAVTGLSSFLLKGQHLLVDLVMPAGILLYSLGSHCGFGVRACVIQCNDWLWDAPRDLQPRVVHGHVFSYSLPLMFLGRKP